MLAAHVQAFPVTDNLMALLMICWADLTSTERQQLQLQLEGVRITEYTQTKIRDVLFAMLINPKTTVDDPHVLSW